MSWNLIFERSRAFLASERSIAASIVSCLNRELAGSVVLLQDAVAVGVLAKVISQ